MDGGAAAGSLNGDVRGKKTIIGVQGAKPPEENSCRAFRSRKLSPQEHNLQPSCTHVRFGVHAVTPLGALYVI